MRGADTDVQAKSVVGSVAYRLIASIVASGVSGRPHGDHVAQFPEVVDVQVRGERVEQDRRAVGRVGEGVRGAGRDHDQRSGGRVVHGLADGEPGRAGHDVEALVVPGVPVLRWTVGVRGERDLADAEAVIGRGAVLQDPHPGRAELDRLTGVRADH